LPPNAPTNLAVTAVSAYQIDLTWQDNSDNEDGFVIEGKVNCFSDFVQIAKVDANVTSYSDKRVLAGITHFYRVRAYNEAGNSGYSNIASATTPTPMNDILAALSRFYQEGAIKNVGIYNSLLVKLQAAQNAQNFNAALNQLNAFANQVQAQDGKGISTVASRTLLALNDILIAYINPDKIASGYALIATFKPVDYIAVRIEAIETPVPYEPVGSFVEVNGHKFYTDNRGYVGETTTGILKLFYYDCTEQCVNINRTIDINNVTRVIYYNGAPVTTIREIFSELLPAPCGDYMYLIMDFPYWLTIFITPATNNQTQPQIPKFKTDVGEKYIKVVPGPDTETPEEKAIAKAIDHWREEDRGLTPTIFSPITPTQVIRPGVITPTCIPPTNAYNCHGWTFACTSGRIDDPADVDTIISGNGYTRITPTASAPAKPGDVVIYRDAHGNAIHSGIVRKVDPATGRPTEVESKWGDFERYKHPPDKVPEEYLPKDNPDTPQNEGGTIEYWRAPRRPVPTSTTDPDKDRNTLKKE
jgi:hypothetical protein